MARSNIAKLLLAAAAATLIAGCGGGSSSDPSSKSSSNADVQAKAQPPSGVTMPSLSGQHSGEALLKLSSLGVHVVVKSRYSDAQKGDVLKTNPPAGSQIKRGDSVELIVSRGPNPSSSSSSASSSSGSGGSSGSGCGAGQYTRADGSCGPIPSSNGGAAPTNSPQGRQQLQQNPDCKNAPPPPPGYTGPVQC